MFGKSWVLGVVEKSELHSLDQKHRNLLVTLVCLYSAGPGHSIFPIRRGALVFLLSVAALAGSCAHMATPTR